MSEEVFKQIELNIKKIEEQIQALPNSSGNGQLIDALGHASCCKEHLRRYFMLAQKTE